MNSYKRLALISAITVAFLACLVAGGLLVSRHTLTYQPFPRAVRSALGSAAASVTARAPLGQDFAPSAGTRRRQVEGYGKLPLSFVANAGQTDPRVKFLARGPGYTLFLTGDEAVLALKKAESRKQKAEARNSKFEIPNSKLQTRNSKPEIGNSKIESATGVPRPLIPNPAASIRGSEPSTVPHESRASAVLRMKLLGANPRARVTGAEELPGKANYFIGNDPKKWRTNVPTYAKVKYKDVYPGVDLLYYGSQSGQLEYDIVVAPGADASAITMDVEAHGHAPLRLDAEGDLAIPTEGGELRFHKPVAYQEQEVAVSSQKSEARDPQHGAANNRKPPITNRELVEARFVLDAQNCVHFAVGPHDHARSLVIDPVLVYSTFLGGTGADSGTGIAVDSSGNAYVTGTTQSSDFPTTSGTLQPSAQGGGDAFVAKLNWNPSSSTLRLVYSTYLGGSYDDEGSAIAVDLFGNAYVTGTTQSSDFPTTAGAIQTSLKDQYSGFVTKLSATGSNLVYSTYLGGSYGASACCIAVDSIGDAYVAGATWSADFPIKNPVIQDVLENGNSATYNGGTFSGSYSISNAFVTRLHWDDSASILSLVYSTFLGGTDGDGASGIAVDPTGDAYVTGNTSSIDFPVTAGAYQSTWPSQPPLPPCMSCETNPSNSFVARLHWDSPSSNLSLFYSTYLGGTGGAGTHSNAIAVDSAGDAYITGWPGGSGLPPVYPLQTSGPIFVSELNPAGSGLVYCTYLGGTSNGMTDDEGIAIAVDSSSNTYVTGWAVSSNFPLKNEASSYGGVFVVKLNWDASNNLLTMVYSTRLGSNEGGDVGKGIAVDSNGSVYVNGETSDNDFLTLNAFQPTFGGVSNAIIAAIGAADSAGIAFTPASLGFGNQIVGTTSNLQTVTLTAAGSQPLNISSITTTGDFALDTDASNCPWNGGTVPSTKTCIIYVDFTPTVAGTRNGTVSVADNASGSPQTVPLNGTGIVVPTVTLSPTSLSFGNLLIGTTSGTKKVTLSASGSGTLAFYGINITGTNSGDFAGSTNCPSSIAPGADCTISVTFTPSGQGPEGASLNVYDNAANSPQGVALSGTGLPPATLTPSPLSFGNVAIGTPSNPKTFTLKNNQSVPLNSITISVVNNTDFQQSSTTCGSTLSAGKSCTISVTFTPSMLSTEYAQLTVSDDAPSPYNGSTSFLSGTGVADVTLTPGSYNFGNVAINTASNAQTFTLHNNELAALSISGVTVTSSNASDFAQTGGTCGASLAGQSSCTIIVTLTPTMLGGETGSLAVTDSAAAPYNSLSSTLSGAGEADVTLGPASASFGNVAIDTASNVKNFTLHNNELTAVTIPDIGFNGANPGDFAQTNSCGNLPATLPAGASCTISVTFTPSVLGAESAGLGAHYGQSFPYQWVASSLSGTGVVPVALTPASHSFGSVAIGTPSNAGTFTLKNNQSATLNISGISFSGTNAGDFAPAGGTCGPSLAAQTSCTILVTLTPSVPGAESATLTVTDDAPAPYNSLSSSLTGTGVPDMTLTPASYNFGNVAINTPSNAHTFTLRNNELAALSISGVTVTSSNASDFAQTGGTCGTSLAGQSSCTIIVTLTPTVLGAETGSLAVMDSAAAPYNSLSSTLSGAGEADVTLGPASASFGSVAINTPSNVKNFTLHNNELTTVNISSIGFAGTNAGDFAQPNNCVGSLAEQASCTISVTLTPSVLGTESASLTVNYGAAAPYSTLSSSLSGTGVVPVALTPASHSFGSVAIGTPSNAGTFTLKNNQSATLNISSISFTGAYAGDFGPAGGTCGSTLAAQTSCTILVTLTPSLLGAESATLTVSDDAPAPYNSLSSSLTGTGVADMTLTPASYNFGNVAINTASNAQTFTLHNNELAALSISGVTVTSSNASDFAQTGGTCGTSLAGQSSCTIIVTLTPTVLGAETGSLAVTDSAPAPYNSLSSALSGAGEADVTLGPASASFGNVAINTPSNVKNFTLHNNQLTAVNISSIGFAGANAGDFAQPNNCVGSLAEQASCTISVTLTPSLLGAESASLTVNYGAAAPYSTLSSLLSGTGVAQASVSPTSLTFSKQTVSTSSTAKTVTLKNNLTTALTITIGFTGADPGDFGETDTCFGSVAAQSSCTISVTFTPSASGTRTATLNVNDSANNSPQTVSLAGTGQ